MKPLSTWSHANFLHNKVKELRANTNTLVFEDSTTLPYDLLSLNVGSQTNNPQDHALSTRPINDLLRKIETKEKEMIIFAPKVVVCGAGAAGVELAFAFKARW